MLYVFYLRFFDFYSKYLLCPLHNQIMDSPMVSIQNFKYLTNSGNYVTM